MSHAPGRFSLATSAILAIGPLVASAGEAPRKAKGSQSVAAHQRAMIHEQAAIQRQALARQQSNRTNNAMANRLASQGGVGNRSGINAGVGHHSGINGQNRNNNSPQMVSSLHSVVAHLNKADHDYDGHRVQAIHQLGQAIHTLQPGTTSTGTGTGLNGTSTGVNNRGTGTGTGSRMPQAQSDAHLRQAHQELQALESQMSGGTGGNVAAHHQQVHNHVQQALQHLNTALASR